MKFLKPMRHQNTVHLTLTFEVDTWTRIHPSGVRPVVRSHKYFGISSTDIYYKNTYNSQCIMLVIFSDYLLPFTCTSTILDNKPIYVNMYLK